MCVLYFVIWFSFRAVISNGSTGLQLHLDQQIQLKARYVQYIKSQIFTTSVSSMQIHKSHTLLCTSFSVSQTSYEALKHTVHHSESPRVESLSNPISNPSISITAPLSIIIHPPPSLKKLSRRQRSAASAFTHAWLAAFWRRSSTTWRTNSLSAQKCCSGLSPCPLQFFQGIRDHWLC